MTEHFSRHQTQPSPLLLWRIIAASSKRNYQAKMEASLLESSSPRKLTLLTVSVALDFLLIISSFVDGEFVEIKTIGNEIGHGYFWEEKALRWYLQSHLIGIERIVVGVHNTVFLKKIQEVRTDDLPYLFLETRLL